MGGHGYVGAMGKYLSIQLGQNDWHIMIRNVDGGACERFWHYHGKTVTNCDVREFIPNWEALEWQPASGISDSREVIADDGEFRVALICARDCPMSDEQIAADFQTFMANTQCESCEP